MFLALIFVFGYVAVILLGVKNYNSAGNLWCFLSPTMIIVLLIIQSLVPKMMSKKVKSIF